MGDHLTPFGIVVIVIASVCAYVAIAGRTYRWLSDLRKWSDSDVPFVFGALWPLTLVVGSIVLCWKWGAKERKNKLPKAEVVERE